MRDSRPQLLDVLFDDASAAGNRSLQNVQLRAATLLKLNRTVKGLLPSPLHPWCRVANYRQSILVLEVANASWMMRLRYELPNLLSALRAQILPSLSSIDIRINPALMVKDVNNPTESAKKHLSASGPLPPVRQLSQESAKELRGLASRSPEKLRKVLERLAALAGEGTNAANRGR